MYACYVHVHLTGCYCDTSVQMLISNQVLLAQQLLTSNISHTSETKHHRSLQKSFGRYSTSCIIKQICVHKGLFELAEVEVVSHNVGVSVQVRVHQRWG